MDYLTYELVEDDVLEESEAALMSYLLGERWLLFNDGTDATANIVEVFVHELRITALVSDSGTIYNWDNVVRVRKVKR